MKLTRTMGAVLTASTLIVAAATPLNAQLTAGDNVRLTFQLIQADGFTDPDPRIGDVVNQFERLFRFEGYRLLTEATVLLAVPDEGDSSSARQGIAASEEDRFRMQVVLEEREGASRLYLELEEVYTEEILLEVGVNVRDGQTVVLGSSKYDPDKPTLIVAVRVNEAG